MDDSTTALLSVRGEARVTVAPDFGVMNGMLKATQDTKPEALEAAAARLGRLTDQLRALGGVPLTAESRHSPLTWAAYAATTEPEHEEQKQTGRYGPTGRVIAWVAVSLTVRDFDLVDRLSGSLATHETFDVNHVSWEVDPDNPAWPDVRASAIQAAIHKGHHYAAALGGSLRRVEHIADVGLLGGDTGASARDMQLSHRSRAHGGMPGTPSLDPVPQELTAIIDARFVATVAAL